jgi:hypothetical protein
MGENTSHLIIVIDVSLGWVEGKWEYSSDYSLKIGRRAVPTPSRRPFLVARKLPLK